MRYGLSLAARNISTCVACTYPLKCYYTLIHTASSCHLSHHGYSLCLRFFNSALCSPPFPIPHLLGQVEVAVSDRDFERKAISIDDYDAIFVDPWTWAGKGASEWLVFNPYVLHERFWRHKCIGHTVALSIAANVAVCEAAVYIVTREQIQCLVCGSKRHTKHTRAVDARSIGQETVESSSCTSIQVPFYSKVLHHVCSFEAGS